MRLRILLLLFLILLLFPSAASADDQPRYATLLRGLNIRSGPSTTYPVVGSLPAGSRVTVIRSVQGQVSINNNPTWFDLGQNRYIYSSLVILGTPVAAGSATIPVAPAPEGTRGVVATRRGIGANVRTGPRANAPVIEVLPEGAPVEARTTVSGDELEVGNSVWYDLGGKYIYSGLVKATTPKTNEHDTSSVQSSSNWHMIAQSTLSFQGSDEARLHNIRLSNSKIDGIIIQPGKRYSINDTLGPTVASAGYKLAEGVAGGQIVPSWGGGVCNTSTTLYRAAFFAGLQINEYINHSVRLHWYDDMPGMDAAIDDYGPYFSFTNNTAAPIQIHAYLDEQKGTQTVELYSPLQLDRTVSLDGPYGDWNSVTNYRVITYSDGRSTRETFQSNYVR